MSVLDNLLYSLFDEVIQHNDASPTRLSCILYSYSQLMYNIGTLFSKANVSNDRVEIPTYYIQLRTMCTSGNIIALKTLLCYGHNGFISALYPNNDVYKPSLHTLSIPNIDIAANIQQIIYDWGRAHILGKELLLTNAKYETAPDSAQPNEWSPLTIPTGEEVNAHGQPLIDVNIENSFTIQTYLGRKWGDMIGFAIDNSTKLATIIPPSQTTQPSKTEIDSMMSIYENLNERQKIIAEFLSSNERDTLSSPGFWVIISMFLSHVNSQNIDDEINMLFSLCSGLFDAGIAAWKYKSLYPIARPIQLIRHYYPTKIMQPYQDPTYVSPSSLGAINEHAVFANVAGKILEWWFNSDRLYCPYKNVVLYNPQLMSAILCPQTKLRTCGEFIFKRGCSHIEPTTTPKRDIILRYKYLKELYNDAGMSQVWGGTQTMESNQRGIEMGNIVYECVKSKLESIFHLSSPYSKKIYTIHI
jgi:hypothetical protein